MTFNGQAVRSLGVFLVRPFGGIRDGRLVKTPRSRVAICYCVNRSHMYSF